MEAFLDRGGLLVEIFLVTLCGWAAVSLMVAFGRVVFHRRSKILGQLERSASDLLMAGHPPAQRAHAMRDLLSRITPRRLYLELASRTLTSPLSETIAAHLVQRWGIERILRDAEGTLLLRRWRRVPALSLLAHLGHPAAHRHLEAALFSRSSRVEAVAIAILARVGDERAARILLSGLRYLPNSASSIAKELDEFDLDIDHLIRPLLDDPSPRVHYWAASLLGRYDLTSPDVARLSALTLDSNPAIRKVALRTLSEQGHAAAFRIAYELLDDPVGYVRTQAIRSLRALGIADQNPSDRRSHAIRLRRHLSDAVWEVRLAAKEALVALGPAVWREVGDQLESTDLFARNGAAEVLQDLGFVDAVVDEIAEGATPSRERMAILERAFREGGPGIVEAAVARSNPSLYPTIASLMRRLGFQDAAHA